MSEASLSGRRMQLFCIPFAGGSKTAFQALAGGIDPSVEVQLLEYPGHESRRQESFCPTMEALEADVLAQLRARRDDRLPYAVLGYSMGSIVTYELLCGELRADPPVHVFLCANEALTNYRPRVSFSEMSEETVLETLASMGGIDERFLRDPRFLRIFLRPVAADYRLLESYRFITGRKNPAVACSVFYSPEDTPRERVCNWDRLFDGPVDFYAFGHNHFFIHEHHREMARVINRKLSGKE